MSDRPRTPARPQGTGTADAHPRRPAGTTDEEPAAPATAPRTAEVGVAGIAGYLPPGRQPVSELADRGLLTEAERERLGVEEVPVAGPDEHPGDLMLTAARRLLDDLGVPAADVDVVITASAVPAEYQLRTLAARVVHELGAVRATGFDLNNGCNAFCSQLELASALLTARPDIHRVLLVTGDRWHEYSQQRVSTGLVWGDAGAAALVTRDAEGAAWVPVAQHSWMDGSLHAVAGVPLGSRAMAEHGGRTPEDLSYTVRDPEAIARDFVPHNADRFRAVAETVLKRAGVGWDELAAVHVPSSRRDVMGKVLRTLGWDPARSNQPYISAHGDLAASSPYVDVAALGEEPWVRAGDHLLVLTQGTGMTWSGTVLRRG